MIFASAGTRQIGVKTTKKIQEASCVAGRLLLHVPFHDVMQCTYSFLLSSGSFSLNKVFRVNNTDPHPLQGYFICKLSSKTFFFPTQHEFIGIDKQTSLLDPEAVSLKE